ncbi:MAG: hemerythrin domain-containing protein [Blastocatellia bacterium]|nr:hemerythrin domain-containing protein [Blastocatellia bacterium]
MKSSRRHTSLIPLSREHQYGLLLCLRIHRGVPLHKEDEAWIRQKADDAIRFFEGDLVPHFKAEEEILFPAMQSYPGASRLIEELLADHRKIERLIERLRQGDGSNLGDVLSELADTLEAHIRKEERRLFPIYEEHVTARTAREVEQKILRLVGDALKPRDPELLK